MKNKWRLMNFMINFNPKPTEHVNKICCLLLEIGMPMLEIVRRKTLLIVWHRKQKGTRFCQSNNFFIEENKMTPIYMDINRWSTKT